MIIFLASLQRHPQDWSTCTTAFSTVSSGKAHISWYAARIYGTVFFCRQIRKWIVFPTPCGPGLGFPAGGCNQTFGEETRCHKQTAEGLNISVAESGMRISAFELFDAITPSPFGLPVCFLSSLCFPIMRPHLPLSLLNKGKHAISHNGIFSSAACPWLERTLLLRECVCVRVWGMRRSGGLRPVMGWVLLSSLNYLARWGRGYGVGVGCSLPERAPALDFAGDLQSAPFFSPLAATFPRGVAETLASRPCLSSAGAPASLRKRGCTDVPPPHQKESVRRDWPKAHLARPCTLLIQSSVSANLTEGTNK